MSQFIRAPALTGLAAAAHTTARGGAAARLDWVDIAKGIGIVLVVFGHAAGGLIDSGIQPSPDWFRPAMLAIYLFHMPLFFFLSGLFFPARQRAGRAGVARRWLSGLIWPYLLWGALQSIAHYTASQYVNSPTQDLGSSLLGMAFASPPSQFWFLYVLFLSQLTAMLLLPRVGAGGVLALSVLAYLVAPASLPIVFSLGVLMLPFFALGCLVGDRQWLAGPPLLTGRHLAAVAGVALLVIGITTAGLILQVGGELFAAFRTDGVVALSRNPAGAAGAVLGMALVIALSLHIHGPAAAALAFLGRYSMAIYVLHILALASTRILLTKAFGVTGPAMVIALVLVGLGVPVLAAMIARRLGIARYVAL